MFCQLCGGDLIHLGTLGRFDHYRCRACGMEEAARAATPDPFEELDRERDAIYRDHCRRFASCGCNVCRPRRGGA